FSVFAIVSFYLQASFSFASEILFSEAVKPCYKLPHCNSCGRQSKRSSNPPRNCIIVSCPHITRSIVHCSAIHLG
uniref:Secreted protein n=1 Tax=Romanomermis culicivorax TaxID=13658 RepID=A0A915HNM9_ROMCU